MRGSVVGLLVILVALAGCTGPTGPSDEDGSADAGMTPVDPDGEWWVDAEVTSCYSATGGNSISVVDGAFEKTLLFTYEQDGQQQSVSVEGTMEWEGGLMRMEGTMWVEGDACNGGNGFSGWLEPATDGTVYSSWGSLHFTKQ